VNDFARAMDLEKLYDEGRRLFLAEKFDNALEQFKRVYELDCRFRDVAEIVQESYSLTEDEWREKFRARFVGAKGKGW
jgi:hypothetical protein